MSNRDWSDGEKIYHERDGLTTTVERVDIVVRLRAQLRAYVIATGHPLANVEEAAAEIERLRASAPPVEKTWFPGDTILTTDGKKYRVHHAMTAVEES